MRDARAVKRDSRGQIRKSSDSVRDSVPFSVPFGPHLIPVKSQLEDSPKTLTTTDLKVSSEKPQRTKVASAVRLDQEKSECSPSLPQCRPGDCADVMSENSEDDEESIHTTITTNDLLDCLVHPDVIARVTELLLERHT